MYYDLDVRVDASQRKAAVKSLQRLGYDVIAFTTTIEGRNRMTPDDVPKRQNYDDEDDEGESGNVNANDGPYPSKRRRRITVLERVTIVVDDISQTGIFNSPELNKFDIVACAPTSERMLLQCLQFDFDVLCLPIEERMMYHVKRPHIHVAVGKGIKFEICYAAGLRDPNNLRTIISNTCNVVRSTKGKHMIMSSGAQSLMEFRAPLDVINLGVLMDINQEHARDAVIKNARDAVSHGDIRARSYQGVVRITAQ